jgi:hypothetical protein
MSCVQARPAAGWHRSPACSVAPIRRLCDGGCALMPLSSPGGFAKGVPPPLHRLSPPALKTSTHASGEGVRCVRPLTGRRQHRCRGARTRGERTGAQLTRTGPSAQASAPRCGLFASSGCLSGPSVCLPAWSVCHSGASVCLSGSSVRLSASSVCLPRSFVCHTTRRRSGRTCAGAGGRGQATGDGTRITRVDVEREC